MSAPSLYLPGGGSARGGPPTLTSGPPCSRTSSSDLHLWSPISLPSSSPTGAVAVGLSANSNHHSSVASNAAPSMATLNLTKQLPPSAWSSALFSAYMLQFMPTANHPPTTPTPPTGNLLTSTPIVVPQNSSGDIISHHHHSLVHPQSSSNSSLNHHLDLKSSLDKPFPASFPSNTLQTSATTTTTSIAGIRDRASQILAEERLNSSFDLKKREKISPIVLEEKES